MNGVQSPKSGSVTHKLCQKAFVSSPLEVIGFYFYNLVVNDGSACFMQVHLREFLCLNVFLEAVLSPISMRLPIETGVKQGPRRMPRWYGASRASVGDISIISATLSFKAAPRIIQNIDL